VGLTQQQSLNLMLELYGTGEIFGNQNYDLLAQKYLLLLLYTERVHLCLIARGESPSSLPLERKGQRFWFGRKCKSTLVVVLFCSLKIAEVKRERCKPRQVHVLLCAGLDY